MNSDNKKYLVFASIIILLTGLCFFAIFSTFKEIEEISDNFIKEKKELALLEAKAKALKEVEGYEEKEEKREVLKGLFGESEKPVERILLLRDLAERNNLTVDISLEREHKSPGEEWPHFQFSVRVRGNFPDLFLFLEEIRTQRWLVLIGEITIRKDTTGVLREDHHSSQRVVADLKIKTYFLEKDDDN